MTSRGLTSDGAVLTEMRTPSARKPATMLRNGLRHVVRDGLFPRDVRLEILDAVLGALTAAGLDPFVVINTSVPGHVVGVRNEHRAAAMTALAEALPGPGMHLEEIYPDVQDQPVVPLTSRALGRIPDRCPAFAVARLVVCASGDLSYGMEYGCSVEFWKRTAEDPEMWEAPRANDAAQLVHIDYLSPATITVEGHPYPSISLFDRTFLLDVDFPVDAVYTWVDGDDPAWRERFLRARAEADGMPYHPEAHADHRYVSRDELRFSLRSLQMYAPWIRHVYLVTDQQRPGWLDPDCDWITVVDHRDIYRDQSALPVFNSSAIITQLHHIEGLSEHYLFLNDDVFFGSDVAPADFWLGNGTAKVFPSRLTRPFGPAHDSDAPHFNISKNIRRELESSLGLSVSTAIRHTPHAQIRSVNDEIEQRYSDVVNATAAHRFRHHADIAQDQLFHYYAQAIGRAIPAVIRYDYVNVGAASSAARLRRLLATRDRLVFCLNDAPEPDEAPLPDEDIVGFLESYFPVPSVFERVHPTEA